MGTCQLKEESLTENLRPSRIAEVWARVDKPTQKNVLSRNPKKQSQGNYRAVQAMMMMIMIIMMIMIMIMIMMIMELEKYVLLV
jgi:flagellar biosynthesis/type III secretory pathway M-ring protein FliF/YscJ